MTPERGRMGWAEWSLAYVVIVGSILLAWNAYGGGLIEGWYAEYVGDDGQLSGSGAWRGEGDFQLFALLLGTWVYPLSGIAALAFAYRAWRSKSQPQRLRCLGAIVVALAMLGCFLQLGVFTAVSQS